MRTIRVDSTGRLSLRLLRDVDDWFQQAVKCIEQMQLTSASSTDDKASKKIHTTDIAFLEETAKPLKTNHSKLNDTLASMTNYQEDTSDPADNDD
jgi:hypothetical protein